MLSLLCDAIYNELQLPARYPPPQIRALAIMSQHLLSPQLEPDDKNTQLFLDAFFEAKALKSILKVRSVTHPPVRGAHSSS